MGNQKQVRVIRPGKYPVYGLSLPKEIGVMMVGVNFSIEKSGTTIILKSGCTIEYTEEQIDNYKFEDCMV